jgi:hypothetical protein
MVLRRAFAITLLAAFATIMPAKGQPQGSRALEGAWEVKITLGPGAPALRCLPTVGR